MQTHFKPLSFRAYAILFLLVSLNFCVLAHAAVRQAWVQHWEGGFPAKTNQPFAMQLDSAGNIYVVGSAANSSNLLDYVTLKYTPGGTLLWSKRYGTTNGFSNLPRAVGLDANDNLYVTGTSVTVKYSSAGDELWTAPYAGRGLALHGTNIYVTGFSETHFATVSLLQNGALAWLRTHQGTYGGPDGSANVFVDADQSVLVIGHETFFAQRSSVYSTPILLKYSGIGDEIGATDISHGTSFGLGAILSQSFLAPSGRLYFVGELDPKGPFQVKARSIASETIWDYYGRKDSGRLANFAAEKDSIVYTAGSFYDSTDSEGNSYFGLVQIKADGYLGWVRTFLGIVPDGKHTSTILGQSTGVTINSASQPCVTGYVPTVASNENIATVKYDTNGNIVWAQQYNGVANGLDEGKAIVTDSSGNVYVAGLSTTAEGGTEIVLIKYSEFTSIEKSPSGSMLLQFPGTPGQPYKVQATTNFPNWLDIGLGTAASNGLLQFEDTNATQYPFRFYQTVIPVH